ncbi:MAG: sensor diguanylate cyclase [Actinotalea sp.]|nr:sensor diguanylate cyclase [Actinotalea sp.]
MARPYERGRGLVTPGPRTIPLLRRHHPAVGAVLAVVVGPPLFTVLERQGLVLAPGWALATLVALAALSAESWFQRLLGGGRVDNRPALRLVLAFAIFSTFSWISGWSFLLPASAVLIAVVHVQRSGSRVWRTAALVAGVFTVLGEVGVELGFVPSVLDAAKSHLAAVWILAISVLGVANVGTSVADREAAGDALARTEARLRALMESSTDVLTVTDHAGDVSYVSPAVERAMGYRPGVLLGTHLLDLVDSEHRDDVARRVREVVTAGAGARTSIDVLMVHASKERRWYEWTVHNLLDDALVQGLVVDQRDVTERLVHQDALAYAAAHDELTGLANRGELMQRLASVLPQAQPGAGVAVLFLDLDHFKAINDTYGHAAGDELLVVVAQRLTRALRPHDVVARLGGDEFCAILTEITDEGEVRAVVERLRTAVGQPVALSAVVVRVGVSIGFVLTTDGTRNPAELFAAADAAMYRVKGARR